MRRISFLLVTLAMLLAGSSMLEAQISYTGGTYSQNFDSMGSAGTTTPSGWFVGTGTTTFNTSTTVIAGTGSSTTGGNYNFGVAGINPVTDRALGSLASSSTQRDTELDLINNTGSAITQFTISYDGEQWRSGGTTQVANTLTLQLSLNGLTWTNLGTGFNFTSPINGAAAGALDGNAAANRVAGIGGTFTLTIPVLPAATFYLRWADPDDSGSDAALAIDNFSFFAVPEPSTLAMMIAGAGLLGASQRLFRKRN